MDDWRRGEPLVLLLECAALVRRVGLGGGDDDDDEVVDRVDEVCREAGASRAMDWTSVAPTTDDDGEASRGGGTGESPMPPKLYRRVMVAMNLPDEVITEEDEVVGESVGEMAVGGGA
jgi:hypothetical protein